MKTPFDKWSNPSVALEISKIMKLSDPTKRIKLTASMASKLKLMGIDFDEGDEISIKDAYNCWKDYKLALKYCQALQRVQERVSTLNVGKCLMYRFGDCVAVAYRDQSKLGIMESWIHFRKYNDDSISYESKILIPEKITEDILCYHYPIKPEDFVTVDPVITEADLCYGRYDEYTLGGKLPTFKSGTYPIDAVDFDYDLPLAFKLGLRTSGTVDKYKIIGDPVRFYQMKLSSKYLMVVNDIKNGAYGVYIVNRANFNNKGAQTTHVNGYKKGIMFLNPMLTSRALFYPIAKK